MESFKTIKDQLDYLSIYVLPSTLIVNLHLTTTLSTIFQPYVITKESVLMRMLGRPPNTNCRLSRPVLGRSAEFIAVILVQENEDSNFQI